MEEGNQSLSNPLDKKRILLMVAGLMLVIIVIGASIFLSSASQKTSQKNSSKNSGKNLGSANSSPAKSGLSPTKAAESPKTAAKNFYDWYVSHPSPIKSGAYKMRDDVTSEFKDIMGTFVSRGIDPGYDHVFCQMSQLPKIVTLKEPEFNEDNTLALIMFQDPSTGNNLFQMKMENIGQKWLVSDVWCPPGQ